MSIDTTIFLGPFLVCSTFPVEKSELVKTCPSEDCRNPTELYWQTDAKFCPICGSEIAERAISKSAANVDTYEARMAIKEALYNVPGDSFYSWAKKNNTEVWLPNITNPDCQRKFSFDPGREDYPPMTPVSSEMMAVEMMQFSSFFYKEIEYLRSLYGEDNVTIRWGLINYSC